MWPLMLDREHHSNIRRRLWTFHVRQRAGQAPLGQVGASAGELRSCCCRPLASSQRKLWWPRRRLAACCGKISMAPKPPLPHQATALFPSFCFSPSKAKMFFYFFWSRESEQRFLVFIFTSHVRYTLLHPFFDISSQHKVPHCLSE